MSEPTLRRGRRGGPSRRTLAIGAVAVAAAAAVAVTVTLVTGGGSGTSTPAAASGPVDVLAPPASPVPKAPGGSSLAPDDSTGVTSDSIKIAIQSPDQQTLKAVGAARQVVDLPRIWKYFIDRTNAAGGVNGRRIDPVYTTTDPIDSNRMREACLTWTRDEKVFAVLGFAGFYGDPVRCVTEENHTPFFDADGQPEQWQDGTSRGLLFSLPTNKSRVLRNFADWMDRTNLLKGRTLGLVENGGFDQQTVQSVLVPALTRRGYRVAATFTFSTDLGEQSRQYALAAAQLRRAGVDTVIGTTSYIATDGVVGAAAKDGYTPQWLLSDYAGGTSDLAANGLPAGTKVLGIAGSRIGEGQLGFPLDPADAACVRPFERAVYGRLLAANDQTGQAAAAICGIWDVVVDGLRGAGPHLTRKSFSDGIAAIGQVDLPAFGASSFRPGKYDGADLSRVVKVDDSCRCWVPYPGSKRLPLPLP